MLQHQNEFPFIIKWHKQSGSFDYYIQARLNEAFEEKAPANAIYKSGSIWHTTDDIRNDQIISEWGLSNKPSKDDLIIALNKTVLKEEAYDIAKDLIEKCNSFHEENRLRGIFKVFEKGEG